jgi:NLR family CARD domain-containing protein 3
MKSQLHIAALLFLLLANASFCADELQFEGKSMNTWLNNGIGRPSNPGEQRPSKEAEQEAAAAFQRMGQRECDWLIAKLPDCEKDQMLGYAIIAALRIAGTNATPEIPKLISLFSQESEFTCQLVARCLSERGANSVRPLMSALTDKSVKVRQMSADVLGNIGRPAMPAVPLLLERFKVEEVQVRASILCALGLIQAYPDLAVPVLIESLSSDDPQIRRAATFSVSTFTNARPALPLLFKLLNDDDRVIRENAAIGLLRFSPGQDFFPLLVTSIDNPDPYIRLIIAQVLSQQKVHTDEVCPALLKLAKDQDPNVRECANGALKKVGCQPPENTK